MAGITACRRRGIPGLSTVELLVVFAILGSLAAMGTLAYQGYMKNVRTKLSATQKLTIEEQVMTDFDLILKGVDAGLRVPGTSQPITATSSCGDFLEALKPRLASYKNPFDGSPAVTFSTAYSKDQKQGKTRITCYRLHGGANDNGASCRLRDAGLRLTYYRLNCGGVCGHPSCGYPGSDCGGASGGGWVHNGQLETFLGTVEARYIMLPDNTVAKLPNGDPWVDWTYGRSVCPGYNYRTIPREADY